MLILLSLILSLTNFCLSEAEADSRMAYSRVDNPCSKKEQWFLGRLVPKPVLELVSDGKHSEVQSLEILIKASQLKGNYTSPEVKGLLDYVISRAYFELGLVHLANRGFNAMLNTVYTESTTGVLLAAVGCVNRIHASYPSIRLPQGLPKTFTNLDIRRIWPDQRTQLWEALVTTVGRKLAEVGKTANIDEELRLLNLSGPYLQYVQANRSIMQETDSSTIFFTELLLKQRKFPKMLENQKDALRLNLGRSYYNLGKFNQAIEIFDTVSNESSLLTQSLVAKAWAHLVENRSSEAVGTAFNLIVGDLRNTFEPDASIITAIAYFENCHYQEALESILFFRKRYDSSYRWLYEWYNHSSTYKQKRSLYALLTESLKNPKKNLVPPKVLSEWIKSPIFLAWQLEMNGLIDEMQVASRLYSNFNDRLRKTRRGKDPTYLATLNVRNNFSLYSNEIPRIEQALIEGINHELSFLNRYMISRWVASYENSQLVEAEIYNEAGESLIRRAPNKNKTEVNLAQNAQPDGGKLPVLDWGEFPVKDEESAETWQDEVGFLKTSITQQCKKKK